MVSGAASSSQIYQLAGPSGLGAASFDPAASILMSFHNHPGATPMNVSTKQGKQPMGNQAMGKGKTIKKKNKKNKKRNKYTRRK